jgi:SHS2 domain-containing protein
MYETFEHTADVGLRVRAATLEELFSEAARGLFSLIVESFDEIEPTKQFEIVVPGRPEAIDFLLFDWLNELLFRFDCDRIVFSKFAVTLSAGGLQAIAWGEPIDTARHRLDHEVKAITYHRLKVAQEADGWMAEVIVDI